MTGDRLYIRHTFIVIVEYNCQNWSILVTHISIEDDFGLSPVTRRVIDRSIISYN